MSTQSISQQSSVGTDPMVHRPLTIIGDVHGKISEYVKLCGNTDTLQLGDMGAGFVEIPVLPLSHRWFRGNHDAPEIAKSHPNYMGDYGYDTEHDVFYIAGGFSIDWHLRLVGISWWPDEELSWRDMSKCQTLYREMRPMTVVSHEGPPQATVPMFERSVGRIHPSSTSLFLGELLEFHRPSVWIFGHWHVDCELGVCGTTFVCLAELSTRTINSRRGYGI